MPTALAIFNDSSSLQRALDDLHSSGIAGEDIRVIEGADHAVGRGGMRDGGSGEGGVADSMVAGGATGQAASPGDTRMATTAGPFVAPGGTSGTPMPAAAVGGLYDSLRGFDVAEEEARFFSDSLGEDSHLLAVSLGDHPERVYQLLRAAGASRLNEPTR